MDTDKQMEVRT